MTKTKGNKRGILIFILLISLSTLLLGCTNKKQSTNQNKKHNKFGYIDKNDISSLKIHNIMNEEKEIKDKSDRDKIIDLIDSVKITKSDVEIRLGVGFGVIITYSNGEKLSASFLATTMAYSTKDNAIWCDIDRNIVDDLRNYYDKN